MAYDIEGGVSSLYDMAAVRLAGFWAPCRSETPPGSIVTLRGWFKFSNDAVSASVRIMAKVSLVCDIADTVISADPSSNRIMPVTGANMASSMATVSTPDAVSYDAEEMSGGVGVDGVEVVGGGTNVGGSAVLL